jgi:hypothetical protein
MLTSVLAVVFLAVALFFVHRSFYGMRIVEKREHGAVGSPTNVPAVAGK